MAWCTREDLKRLEVEVGVSDVLEEEDGICLDDEEDSTDMPEVQRITDATKSAHTKKHRDGRNIVSEFYSQSYRKSIEDLRLEEITHDFVDR